jgi:Tol biopolymer transport system component
VKKQLALVVLGLVVVLVAAGSLARATAGPEPNDIQDSLPRWSSDGSRIAFERTAPSLQHVVTMKPSGKDLFVASGTGLFRGFIPGTQSPPYMLVQIGDNTIATIGGRFAGPAAELHGVDATASPDGTRVAYLRGGTLYVARLDSVKLNSFPIPVPAETAVATGVVPSADDVVGPVWSKDGTQIVVDSGSQLLVTNSDGSRTRTIPDGGPNPSFDPAGTTIAYERNVDGQWQVWVVGIDGSNAHELLGGSTANYRFPTFSPASSTLAFITDKQHAIGGATKYQYALYLLDGSTSTERKLLDDVHPYSPPAWDPTGRFVAITAGQECRRWGTYVVPTTGGGAHRRSNLCRYDGTSRADRITGSPYFDIINGLGGNDRLDGFWGNDKILGENGNDVILGSSGNDTIFGGPGNDVIFGGPGNDTIIPGPGADKVDCGPGNDTVEGVDRLDRIAKNCEHVRH